MKYVSLILLAVLVCLVHGAVAAQSASMPDNAVFTYKPEGWGFSYNYVWTPDNKLLIDDLILDAATNEKRPISVTYDPYAPRGTVEAQLSASPTLPVHDHALPPTFKELFATSPDGRFDLYSVEHEYTYQGSDYFGIILGMVNHATGDSIILPNIHLIPEPVITWSSNNETFVMAFRLRGLELDEPVYAYITGFADDMSQAHGVTFSQREDISDTLDWIIFKFYDLDSTGRYILADGYYDEPDSLTFTEQLLIIDMTDFSYEVVAIKGDISVANFEKPGQHVFYVGNTGLFAYDRQEKTSILLLDSIVSSKLDYDISFDDVFPSFSPDGRYLATRIDHQFTSQYLFVYPIPQIPDGK